MNIYGIVAHGEQRQIGLAGGIPWHYTEDLKRFKETTKGGILIMGKATFESIGKPLPGRVTIIVSKTIGIVPDCFMVATVQEAVELAGTLEIENVFFAGGQRIYEEGLEYMSHIYVTEVPYSGEADAYFPELDTDIWTNVHLESCTTKNGDVIVFNEFKKAI